MSKLPFLVKRSLRVEVCGGEGSQGTKSQDKGKMSKDRRKENQRWCITTRLAAASQENTASAWSCRMSTERLTEPMSKSNGPEWG